MWMKHVLGFIATLMIYDFLQKYFPLNFVISLSVFIPKMADK